MKHLTLNEGYIRVFHPHIIQFGCVLDALDGVLALGGSLALPTTPVMVLYGEFPQPPS